MVKLVTKKAVDQGRRQSLFTEMFGHICKTLLQRATVKNVRSKDTNLQCERFNHKHLKQSVKHSDRKCCKATFKDVELNSTGQREMRRLLILLLVFQQTPAAAHYSSSIDAVT